MNKRYKIKEHGKICSNCHIEKPYDEFPKQTKNIDGYNYWCKECMKPRYRNSNYKSKYGITTEDYNKMFEEQNGKCAICGRTGEQFKNERQLIETLVIDHDHVTYKIRGLLCSDCNLMLGSAWDDIEILKSAIIYCEKHKMKRTTKLDRIMHNLRSREMRRKKSLKATSQTFTKYFRNKYKRQNN